jgi:hypothetical protein
VTRYVVEMRVPVIADAPDLARVRDELREKASAYGWVPRFLTVEEWRYWAQFQKPLPFRGVQARPEAEHVGKIRRPTVRRTDG